MKPNLVWSEHEKLAEIIGAAVATGNIDWDHRYLGLKAIDALYQAGYQIMQSIVVLKDPA